MTSETTSTYTFNPKKRSVFSPKDKPKKPKRVYTKPSNMKPMGHKS